MCAAAGRSGSLWPCAEVGAALPRWKRLRSPWRALYGSPARELHLGLPLADAQGYLQALQAAGGKGYLVPIRYRHPRISARQGLRLAQIEFERIREVDREFGLIVLFYDDFLWWMYHVPDIELRKAGCIPGAIVISIDKFDGHVGTEDERREWARLSK